MFLVFPVKKKCPAGHTKNCELLFEEYNPTGYVPEKFRLRSFYLHAFILHSLVNSMPILDFKHFSFLLMDHFV